MENYTLLTSTDTSQNERQNEPLNTGSVRLDSNAIIMHVKAGSKVSNLTNYAFRNFQKSEINQITWNGSGDALNKVVSCAEVTKKHFKNLYQINKIGFIKNEDVWKSNLEELRDYQTNAILDDLFRVKKDNSKSASTSRKRNDTLKRTQQSNDDLVPPYDQVDRDQGIFVKMSKTPKTSNKKENNKPNNKE